MNRRELLSKAGKLLVLTGAASAAYDAMQGAPTTSSDSYKTAEHWWGMIIDIEKCIGCGNCVRACADENSVPDHFFRTWVERYHVEGWEAEHPQVDSPNGGKNGRRSWRIARRCSRNGTGSIGGRASISRGGASVLFLTRCVYNRGGWRMRCSKICVSARACSPKAPVLRPPPS